MPVKRRVVRSELQGMGLLQAIGKTEVKGDRPQKGREGPVQQEKGPRKLLGLQRARLPDGRGAA